MKRFVVFIVCALLGLSAYAQKDTTVINSNVVFDTEVTTSKTGNEKINYIVKYNNEWYMSDKTSYKRYNDAIRFKCRPNVALVEDRKTKSKKIIVL